MQVEQLRRSRLEAEDYKEQAQHAQQQVRQQAHSLHLLQQQHQQLLDQVCQQSQRALEGSAAHLQQHEGAALDQVRGPSCAASLPRYCAVRAVWLLCCAVLCCAVLCCAVLCCAMLCCAGDVLCCGWLCYSALCFALLQCAILL